jgi:two-component system sensor histidine kinase KdpD
MSTTETKFRRRSNSEPSLLSIAPRRFVTILARLLPYAASAGLVGAAALISKLSFEMASAPTLCLVFLVAVVISAHRFGLWPAIAASVLSVLCWDYFFTLPYYSLRLSDSRDVFALVAFSAVSLVISGLTAQIRRQNERLTGLAQSASASYELSETLSQLSSVDEIAEFATKRIADWSDADAIMVLIDHGERARQLVFPRDAAPESADMIAAQRALFPLFVQPTSSGAATSRYEFISFDGPHGRVGCIGIPLPARGLTATENRPKLDAILNQTAIAIERAWLAGDVENARMAVATERIRNALLTSVSHDLRTPLTTIIGALSALKTTGDAFNTETRDEFIDTAHGEAERLDRFVGNLLDIVKLESGSLKASLAPVDIDDIVGAAVDRARTLLSRHRLKISLPPDLSEATADPVLLEQVVFNLLDNAAKYSPANGTIEISARSEEKQVLLMVVDNGPGIPGLALEKIFEKFTRFDRTDSVSPGTGLGLMICRGFLSVMGGTIVAANLKDGSGARFTISLKRWPGAHGMAARTSPC